MKVKTMTVRYVPANRGISRINIGQNSERLINSCRSDKVRSLHQSQYRTGAAIVIFEIYQRKGRDTYGKCISRCAQRRNILQSPERKKEGTSRLMCLFSWTGENAHRPSCWNRFAPLTSHAYWGMWDEPMNT